MAATLGIALLGAPSLLRDAEEAIDSLSRLLEEERVALAVLLGRQGVSGDRRVQAQKLHHLHGGPVLRRGAVLPHALLAKVLQRLVDRVLEHSPRLLRTRQSSKNEHGTDHDKKRNRFTISWTRRAVERNAGVCRGCFSGCFFCFSLSLVRLCSLRSVPSDLFPNRSVPSDLFQPICCGNGRLEMS
jgi:hypothetical protein